MALKIYNSLTKQKEEFKPLKEGEVKMYVCGPTVYDEPHIGHLRSAYVFDVMRRYLEYSGYKVTFVRNVTDVDDKIIEKARQNEPADLLAEVKSVSEKYFLAYKADLKALGIQEPTKEPKATEHIKDMIWLIERLLKNGFAYESQSDVYFDVNAFKLYGKLSHQKKDEMLEHARIDPNEKKRNPLDFALWKKAKEGEPFWESPWGKGRPGWHIECSAMSMKYLGETFDIHGGGRDLIFPHHENEIAQSEGVTSSPFARYWVHHGLVTINHQKMSKSLNNFVTLKSLIEEKKQTWSRELKFLFVSTHYNSPLDFSDASMLDAYRQWARFSNFFIECGNAPISDKFISTDIFKRFDTLFRNAMDDDFNTPNALAAMHEVIDIARKSDTTTKYIAREFLFRCSKVLGGLFEWSELEHYLTHRIEEDGGISFEEPKIMFLIKQREEARKNKNFKLADDIRKELLEKYKIELVETKNGTVWKWVI